MWCVCTTTTAVTSTTTSGSLTPAADSHGNRPCLLPALAGAEKRPQIACRRRPANGGHLCVNIDHSRGTSSSKGCPWSQHSTEPAEGLKIWGTISNISFYGTRFATISDKMGGGHFVSNWEKSLESIFIRF